MGVNITLQQFEFFRAVARNHSFSNAAKELFTSQPYVSNQIRKLEDHYGVPLFLRSYPKIALTEAGQVLYERIEGILSEVDKLEHVVQQFQGLNRGTVHVAATASAGSHVLPDLVGQFSRAYPDIIVQVRIGNTSDVLDWLSVDDVEVAVTPETPDGRSMTSERFYRERLTFIGSAGNNYPDPLTASDLARIPRVIREDGSLTLTKMRELLREQPSGRDFVAQFTGTTAVNEAVAGGLGVSLVPERSAKAWIEAGLVTTLAFDGPPAHLDYYIVYAQQRYVTPATEAFIRHLRQSVASEQSN